MHALIYDFIVLARRWDLRSMSSGFNSRQATDNALQTVIFVAVITLICIGLLVFDRWARPRRRAQHSDSPADLFLDLCRVHHLNWSSRRLLKRLAAHWQLPNPTMLFVEPERFNIARLPAQLQPYSDQIEHLHAQLFDAL